MLLFSLFHIWENWGRERVSNLFQGTWAELSPKPVFFFFYFIFQLQFTIQYGFVLVSGVQHKQSYTLQSNPSVFPVQSQYSSV